MWNTLITTGTKNWGRPGGVIEGELKVEGYTQMEISGINFSIDGSEVGFGKITASSGLLTGTLSNGNPINCNFTIADYAPYTASIELVPEPSTFLLLSLGTVMLRKRKQ